MSSVDACGILGDGAATGWSLAGFFAVMSSGDGGGGGGGGWSLSIFFAGGARAVPNGHETSSRSDDTTAEKSSGPPGALPDMSCVGSRGDGHGYWMDGEVVLGALRGRSLSMGSGGDGMGWIAWPGRTWSTGKAGDGVHLRAWPGRTWSTGKAADCVHLSAWSGRTWSTGKAGVGVVSAFFSAMPCAPFATAEPCMANAKSTSTASRMPSNEVSLSALRGAAVARWVIWCRNSARSMPLVLRPCNVPRQQYFET